MQTNAEHFKELNRGGWPCSYYGEHPDWFQVISKSRDSKIIEESNFRATLKALKKISEDGIIIETARHWGCGWIETLIIDPSNEKLVREATEILNALADYPIVDDEDFSNLEREKLEAYWNRMPAKDRIALAKEYGGSGNLVRYCKMSLDKLYHDDPMVSQKMYRRIEDNIR